MTRNPEIPMAKSLVDYIFRWLAMEFVPNYRATNSPQRGTTKRPEEPSRIPSPFSGGTGVPIGGRVRRQRHDSKTRSFGTERPRKRPRVTSHDHPNGTATVSAH